MNRLLLTVLSSLLTCDISGSAWATTADQLDATQIELRINVINDRNNRTTLRLGCLGNLMSKMLESGQRATGPQLMTLLNEKDYEISEQAIILFKISQPLTEPDRSAFLTKALGHPSNRVREQAKRLCDQDLSSFVRAACSAVPAYVPTPQLAASAPEGPIPPIQETKVPASKERQTNPRALTLSCTEAAPDNKSP
jgi:hypothetical protein